MEGDSGEESPLHLFCLFVVLIYSIKTLFDLMSIIMVCYWLFCVNSKLNFEDEFGKYFKDFKDDKMKVKTFIYVDVLDFDLDAEIDRVESEESIIKDLKSLFDFKKENRRLRIEESKVGAGQVAQGSPEVVAI